MGLAAGMALAIPLPLELLPADLEPLHRRPLLPPAVALGATPLVLPNRHLLLLLLLELLMGLAAGMALAIPPHDSFAFHYCHHYAACPHFRCLPFECGEHGCTIHITPFTSIAFSIATSCAPLMRFYSLLYMQAIKTSLSKQLLISIAACAAFDLLHAHVSDARPSMALKPLTCALRDLCLSTAFLFASWLNCTPQFQCGVVAPVSLYAHALDT